MPKEGLLYRHICHDTVVFVVWAKSLGHGDMEGTSKDLFHTKKKSLSAFASLHRVGIEPTTSHTSPSLVSLGYRQSVLQNNILIFHEDMTLNDLDYG